MDTLLNKWMYRLAMLGILLAAYYLRIAGLANTPPGIYYDEGRLLQRAWRLTEGYGLVLYFQDIAEPFDVMLRAVYHALSGGVHLFMGQMFSIWLNILAVAAVIRLACILYRQHRHRAVISLVAGLTLATMPPFVMLGKHIYRANWLPLTISLALIWLFLAWRDRHLFQFVLAGCFIALSTMMYTGGLFFPPAILLMVGVQMLISRKKLPSRKQLALLLGSFSLVMLPWLYLFVRIPNWLSRVSDLSVGRSPFTDISLLPSHLQLTLSAIFLPGDLHDMRYNTFTTAFLNPALIALLIIGMGSTIWRWRKTWVLSPLILGLVMLWPNILSSEPYQPVRSVGVFVALALLVGFGAGQIVLILKGRPVFWSALVVVCFATPLHTGYHIWYHFNEQALITNPHVPNSLALKYRVGFEDLLRRLADADGPTYFPVVHLNTDLAVAVSRLEDFPLVRGYMDENLPAGQVILPRNDLSYGFFPLDDAPVHYALLLPERGEIVILPGLSKQQGQVLAQEIREQGEDILNADGWLLGQSLQLTDDTHAFADLRNVVGDVLAIYDETLELVGIDAPSEIIPGERIPVTLFWRLRAQNGKDYFSRLQVWDFENSNQGFERRSPLVNEADFPLNILYNIYPTVMWDAGEIVADTRWLPVSETAPPGGYRFALAVYDYPGHVPVDIHVIHGQRQSIWGLVGRTAVAADNFFSESHIRVKSTTRSGNFYLIDYDLSMDGQTLQVQLQWHVGAVTNEDYIGYVHILDAAGQLVAQQDKRPYDGQFPTWAWPLASQVSTQFSLQIPENAQAPFTITTGMYQYPSLQRLEVIQEGVVQIDNSIRLR